MPLPALVGSENYFALQLIACSEPHAIVRKLFTICGSATSHEHSVSC